jgi:PUA domain protein
MFRTFTSESLGTQQVAKSSVARQIREELQNSFPSLDLDTLVPKKANLQLTKGRGEQNHIKLLGVDGVILFFQDRDGPWLPSLKTVEKFPDIMPAFTCDKGGKDFVLRGAKVMAPGLTSAGGAVASGVEKNKPVQILIEGEKGPQAVGITLMSSAEITTEKKGIAVDNIHFRGDGLFTLLQQGAL